MFSIQLEEIKCPFFSNFSRGRHQLPALVCEGLYDGCFDNHVFPSNSAYFRHKEVFCNSLENCPKCPYFQVACFKYGDI